MRSGELLTCSELAFLWYSFMFLVLFCSNSAVRSDFSVIQLMCDEPADRQMDGRMDGRTDGRTQSLKKMQERILQMNSWGYKWIHGVFLWVEGEIYKKIPLTFCSASLPALSLTPSASSMWFFSSSVIEGQAAGFSHDRNHQTHHHSTPRMPCNTIKCLENKNYQTHNRNSPIIFGKTR